MDIWRFGALLFTRDVFAAGATSAYDLFFTDKTSPEKAAELQKVLKDTINNIENAGASVIGSLIPIPGAADMIRGLVTSTAAEAWETTLTTIAAENIVAAVRPLFHLAQGSTPKTPIDSGNVNTQDIPPVLSKNETQNQQVQGSYQTPAQLGLQSTYPAAQYPAAQYPAAQYPAAQYPAAQYPAAQYPAAQYPAATPATAPLDPFRFSEPHPTEPLNPAQPGTVVQAGGPFDPVGIQGPVTVNNPLPPVPKNGGA